jgi:4a-hydroxytetrahydrobiopterin dehydratase
MTWLKNGKFLEKNFSFDSFTHAIDFINNVAEIAEKLNHHPEILLHNYNQVRIQTTTHYIGTITQKDYDLTDQIDLYFMQ